MHSGLLLLIYRWILLLAPTPSIISISNEVTILRLCHFGEPIKCRFVRQWHLTCRPSTLQSFALLPTWQSTGTRVAVEVPSSALLCSPSYIQRSRCYPPSRSANVFKTFFLPLLCRALSTKRFPTLLILKIWTSYYLSFVLVLIIARIFFKYLSMPGPNSQNVHLHGTGGNMVNPVSCHGLTLFSELC